MFKQETTETFFVLSFKFTSIDYHDHHPNQSHHRGITNRCHKKITNINYIINITIIETNDIYQNLLLLLKVLRYLPANIFNLFKVNNRNTRKRCEIHVEICSKSTIKTSERRHWRRSGVFTVSFEHISHLFLVFLLVTLIK